MAEVASVFYSDGAEIYDLTTRCRNLERNPTGFSLADAPILGLLVRTWKALKLMLRYYDEGNAQFMTFVERPFVEASVIKGRHVDALVAEWRRQGLADGTVKNRLAHGSRLPAVS